MVHSRPMVIPAGQNWAVGALRAVPYVQLEVVKKGDGLERLVEVPPAASMVTQNAPDFEPGDRVLDPRSATAVSSPSSGTPR